MSKFEVINLVCVEIDEESSDLQLFLVVSTLFFPVTLFSWFIFSLANMYKCLTKDIDGFEHPGHGHLIGWSKQGRTHLLLGDTVMESHGVKKSSMV